MLDAPTARSRLLDVETIYHDLEEIELDLPTLQLWFRNALSEWQGASRFVFKRLTRTILCPAIRSRSNTGLSTG